MLSSSDWVDYLLLSIKQLIMENMLKTLILVSALLLSVHCANNVIRDTLLSTMSSMDFQQPISVTAHTIVSIKFKILNPPSSLIYAFAEASLYPINVTRRRQSFYQLEPQDVPGIDLEGLWMAKNQSVNLLVPTAGATDVYLRVYNLDPVQRRTNIDFQITIADGISTPSCQSCQYPSHQMYGVCKCERCPSYLSGYDCSRQVIPLQSGRQVNGTISLNSFAYFEVPNTQKPVRIRVRSLNGEIQFYFQVLTFGSEIANYVNVAQVNNIEGRFTLNDLYNSKSFNANPDGKRMGITLAKYRGNFSSFAVYYQEVNSINIVAVVLGILGGLVGIGIIGAAIYFIRRSRAQGHSGLVADSQQNLSINSNRLTALQIERYFPEFTQAKLQGLEDSHSNIKQESSQKDCVICLCPIEVNDAVRITYCRHTFHSTCLINWFKKQRNCPYCREDSSRSNTIKHFTEVIRLNGNTVLEGEALVRVVIRYNHLPSSNKVNEQIIQSQPQQIQVFSIQ